MERWMGKVAIVTGVSSGIGATIAEDLVKHGVHVVGLARRIQKLEEMAVELKNAPGKLYPKKCDITKEQDILGVFQWVNQTLGPIHILINNAGVFNEIHLHDFKTEQWLQMVSVNILGLSLCTRETVKSMRELGVTNGHIININSFLGHTMSDCTGLNLYATTKHAVTTITESLRRELTELKSQIKVSSISPGIVRTEFLSAGVTKTLSPELYNMVTCLEPKDVANAVLYALSTPPHLQVQELTILPIGQAS